MAKIQDINNAFLTTKTKNDLEIEKATKRNVSRISEDDTNEIHTNLMKVFNIKSYSESKYFNIENWKKYIAIVKEEKRARDLKKQNKENNKRNY